MSKKGKKGMETMSLEKERMQQIKNKYFFIISKKCRGEIHSAKGREEREEGEERLFRKEEREEGREGGALLHSPWNFHSDGSSC